MMRIWSYRPRRLARTLRGSVERWPTAKPAVLLVATLLILAGSALVIARGDGTREIAADASTQIWANSVSASASTVRSDLREALIVAQSAVLEVVPPDEVTIAATRLRNSVGELDDLLATGSQLGDGGEVVQAGEMFTAETLLIADALDLGDIEQSLSLSGDEFTVAYSSLVDESVRLREEMAQRTAVVVEGLGKVTNAARFVAALLIPAAAVLVFFRQMRIAQRESVLKTELRRERELHRQKDTFLAAASHHIKTPLAAVVGFAELLRDRTRDFSAGVRSEVTELLAIQAQETSNVVDDLLVAARYDLGELSTDEVELEARDVVDKATEDWQSTQRTRLTVSGNAKVVADPRWLAHALRNVLRNAASFEGENIGVRISEGNSHVSIDIADDGPGIPDDETERIFDVYYSHRQLEGLAPSLGLGLSVARRIALSMGGDLVYHRVDGENVFELSIPKASTVSFIAVKPVRIIDPQAGRPDEEAVTDVIGHGGPDMVFQPIVDLRARNAGAVRVVGYEALARFPSHTPSDWVEASSTMGLRVDLELACISGAVKAFAPAEADAFVAVNLSDRTLQSSRLDDCLDQIDPSRMVLELSEGSSIKSYETTRNVVEALSARGIRLAIDDVGSGDIDLWHISRMGAAIIKIDIALVRDLQFAPRNRALIRGVQAMADDLGLVVIAEGIENEEENEQLLELGVQFGQGFLYGRPGPLLIQSDERVRHQP